MRSALFTRVMAVCILMAGVVSAWGQDSATVQSSDFPSGFQQNFEDLSIFFSGVTKTPIAGNEEPPESLPPVKTYLMDYVTGTVTEGPTVYFEPDAEFETKLMPGGEGEPLPGGPAPDFPNGAEAALGAMYVVDHTVDFGRRNVAIASNPNFPGGGNCSGSLVDPRVVITASHCISNAGNPPTLTPPIHVAAGYTDTTVRATTFPYGTARATFAVAYQWGVGTGAARFQSDVGILILDRPIGALTGWFGWGMLGNCSDFKNNTFLIGGYPGECCTVPTGPNAGALANGEQLLYRNGRFDACQTRWYNGSIWTGNIVSFNSYICGGYSGSGNYLINPQGRFVCAITSHGFRPPGAGCPTPGPPANWGSVRIFPQFYADIGARIAAITPGGNNLYPLDVNVTPAPLNGGVPEAKVVAGNPLPNLDYLVHQYSSATFNGQVSAAIYLSTDNNIQTTDTLLGTDTFNLILASKDSHRRTVPAPPTVPLNTPAGFYFVGVILNGNANDNRGDGEWDTTVVRVDPAGACCLPGNVCLPGRSPEQCTAVSGLWQGIGTTCQPNPCNQPSGACCYSGASICQIRFQQVCVQQGGLYQGDGTTCNPNPCPVLGACCAANGGCTIKTQLDCQNEPANWLGAGIACLPNNPCPQVGACCDPTGQAACAMMQEAQCAALGRQYLGDHVPCDPNPCAGINTGACCNIAADCVIRTQQQCTAEGGNFQGIGQHCFSGTCPLMPAGACCKVDGTCDVRTFSSCLTFPNALYSGDNSTCQTVLCSGACCANDGGCTLSSELGCSIAGKTFRGLGTNCNPNMCPNAAGPGACCIAEVDVCIDILDAVECDAFGGVFMGVGVSCDPDPCAPVPEGACCSADIGLCLVTTPAECISIGLTYQGDGTACDPNPCAPVTGACCFVAAGDCEVLTQEACTSGGGAYQGDNSPCDLAACTGACCYDDASCAVTTQADCQATGGNFQGQGSDCQPNNCQIPPMGACCFAAGDCIIASAFSCADAFGTYQGDSTTCGQGLCAQPTVGACCDNAGNCYLLTAPECSATGLVYLGDGTNCNNSPCAQLPTGRCCSADGSCVELTQPGCTGIGGRYEGNNSSCEPESCPPAICGDLDADADVDGGDFAIFLAAYSGCMEVTEPGTAAYNAFADYDHDACITLVDYQIWLACYRAFIGAPAPPPIPVPAGDMNADWHVDGLDIRGFADVLLNPRTATFRELFVSDFNGDGTCDTIDLNLMVERLLGGN